MRTRVGSQHPVEVTVSLMEQIAVGERCVRTYVGCETRNVGDSISV